MSEKKSSNELQTGRRGFIKAVAAGMTLQSVPDVTGAPISNKPAAAQKHEYASSPGERIRYPRTFSGKQLSLIAFPLGGIGTGSISLGGRGQLRDWEIYNRPDKARSPEYAFASIWIKSGDGKPITHVLEAELAPPYASADGLGPANAPGLSRLQGATFTGEFPMAQIEFRDTRLPARVSLEAFSPFVPLDPENSGFPVAILRYRVRNTSTAQISASIAFSLDNPVGPRRPDSIRRAKGEKLNEFRGAAGDALQGLYMTAPQISETDPEKGSFALCVLNPGDGRVSYLRGWPNAKWWASPMLFWDDFSQDGELGPEAADRKLVGSLCLGRKIPARGEAEYTFLFSWHFPNRTPAWSGWVAPKGHENDVIGNHYCTRFSDAWLAAQHAAQNLPELEKRTRRFVETMRASTLPDALRDAAVANLSTLVTQTCFRTADGEFHGFEGCNDHLGCCFGNCTHVWNYETATQFVFPILARSLRKAAFGFSQDPQGGMRFRQMLPDGIDRFGYAAADGQMGQIIKTYLDWRQCGDTEWLRGLWPHIQKALSFAWIPGGWDANRDGVMEGVQHNTYDVEFYGPNPLGGVYYLGALRAAEEMGNVLGDRASAQSYRALFERGRAWIDSNLFNGEYYVQKVRSIPRSDIAPATVGDMGADHPEKPEFQLGDGCLADQLIGQYLADMADLGPLLDPVHIHKTLEAIQKYNYRKNLFEHDSVQRVYVLNDEPAILVCDYGKGTRPKIPFPYYAESWTGIEYLVATQFIVAGMLQDGLRTIEDVRFRFDGERRNPWDEPECGHHYARAMSSWSTLIAFSGFHYNGAEKMLSLKPRSEGASLRSPWFTNSGWGTFSATRSNRGEEMEISVTEGSLTVQSIRLRPGTSAHSSITLEQKGLEHKVNHSSDSTTLNLDESLTVADGKVLLIRI
jgi:non-lysosomal glucosylceramidase